MSWRDTVQRAVVESNRFWPFSVANRIPYRVAVATSARRMSRIEHVRGLHLRNGLVGAGWVPGISDIDLTVVVEDVPDAEREYALIEEIWREHRSSKRVFPMVGELDVLSEAMLPSWSRFAIPGYEVRSWQPLRRAPAVRSEYRASEGRLRVDALSHALLVYRGVLMRRLFGRPRSPVHSRAVRRIAEKVARYAALARGDGEREPGFAERDLPASRSVALALESLDSAARAVRALAPWPDPPLALASARLRNGSWMAAARYDEEGIESIVDSFGARILIVADPRDPSLPDVLDRLVEAHDPAQAVPLVVTAAPLEHLLRHADPFLYTHLLRVGRVVQGAPVELPEPPTESAYHHAVLAQVPNLLSVAHSQDLLSPFDEGFIGGPGFKLAVERALFARMLLEHGRISPWHHEADAQSRRLYGSVWARLAEIRELRAGAGFEAFVLLRTLAREVSHGIESGQADASLFPA